MKWGKAERKGERREGRKQLQQRSIRCFSHASMKQLLLDGLVVMIRLSHSRERGSIPRRGKHILFLPCSSSPCLLLPCTRLDAPSIDFPLLPSSTPLTAAECVESENSFPVARKEKRKHLFVPLLRSPSLRAVPPRLDWKALFVDLRGEESNGDEARRLVAAFLPLLHFPRLSSHLPRF
jgi:hypothetical protein